MEDEFKTQVQKYSKDVLVAYIIKHRFFEQERTIDELNDIKKEIIANSIDAQLDKNLEDGRQLNAEMKKAREDKDDDKWLELFVKSRKNDKEWSRLDKKFTEALARN